MEAELVELINSFASASAEDTSSTAREGLKFLKKSGNRDQAHNRLCSALLERAEGGNADIRNLLFFAGEDQALVIIYNNIAHTKYVNSHDMNIGQQLKLSIPDCPLQSGLPVKFRAS